MSSQDRTAAQGRDDSATISAARAHVEFFGLYVGTEQAVADLGALADLAETLLAENEELREKIAEYGAIQDAMENGLDLSSVSPNVTLRGKVKLERVNDA